MEVLKSWPSCLLRPASTGVRSCPLDTTSGVFAVQRLSFNFLCTQQKKILYPKWGYFGIVCILQNGKRLHKFLPFYLGGFLLKWMWNSTLGYIASGSWSCVFCCVMSIEVWNKKALWTVWCTFCFIVVGYMLKENRKLL